MKTSKFKLSGIILMAGASVLFTNCNCGNSSGNSEANIAIVSQYIDAVQTGNVETMGALLADDYLGLGPSVGDSVNKETALANWENNMTDLFEKVEYTKEKSIAVTVDEGPAAGDWVTSWAYLTISYKNGLGPVNLWVNAIYKIADGKISESRTFYNEADVMRQLGYYITPPLIETE